MNVISFLEKVSLKKISFVEKAELKGEILMLGVDNHDNLGG